MDPALVLLALKLIFALPDLTILALLRHATEGARIDPKFEISAKKYQNKVLAVFDHPPSI